MTWQGKHPERGREREREGARKRERRQEREREGRREWDETRWEEMWCVWLKDGLTSEISVWLRSSGDKFASWMPIFMYPISSTEGSPRDKVGWNWLNDMMVMMWTIFEWDNSKWKQRFEWAWYSTKISIHKQSTTENQTTLTPIQDT